MMWCLCRSTFFGWGWGLGKLERVIMFMYPEARVIGFEKDEGVMKLARNTLDKTLTELRRQNRHTKVQIHCKSLSVHLIYFCWRRPH